MKTATKPAKKTVIKKKESLPTATDNLKQSIEKENAAISPTETAKKIELNARPGDPFLFDDAQEAQEVFSKLPEGQFIIKEGETTLIQKL